MQTKINQSIFTQLNNTKHRAIQDGQFSLFPDKKQNTPAQDTEYWFFSDIYNIHNNKNTPTHNLDMNNIVSKNLVMPKKISNNKIELIPHDIQFLTDHTNTVKHAYTIGYHEYKHANDLQLTRYACWCLVKNHPNNAFSYTYFMSPIISENTTFNELEKLSYQFARPHARDTITKYNIYFNSLISKLNGDIKTFNYNKIVSFFNGHDSASLKFGHNIHDIHTPIFDYMGTLSLNYMINGMHIAIQTFNQSGSNPNKFTEILYKQLTNARQEMIRYTGIKPENDIQQTNITQVKKLLQQTENEFIKKYANIKLH